ncbi:hypothetical protein JCM3775_002550 [Rhodotorula graminis]
MPRPSGSIANPHASRHHLHGFVASSRPTPLPYPFLSNLSAFLYGLAPSLVALAPLLVSASVRSVVDLVALVQLEPGTFDLFAAEAARQTPVRVNGSSPIELLDVLKQGLDEGKWRARWTF